VNTVATTARMPKVWNKRDPNTPKDAVYVGRPTKWGNPFIIDRDGNREQVVEKYRQHYIDKFWRDQIVEELKGKDLVCWCAPKACHADVLLEIANASSNT
jgi:hypothetical protein